MPVECPEGEQLTPDGLGCEPIMAEEPTQIECDEGEELIDGQCQAIPTEEEDTDGDEGGDGEEGDEEAGADEEAAE